MIESESLDERGLLSHTSNAKITENGLPFACNHEWVKLNCERNDTRTLFSEFLFKNRL